MAVCDTGMLCPWGMCVTRSSSHAEDCQVLLTRHRELLRCCACHPLTLSHVLGHSCSSTRGSAHTCGWARPLPVWTSLFLGSREGLAIASLLAQGPLDLTSGRAREEDDAARPVALRWGNSIHVLPKLWVTPVVAWALRLQLEGNILRPRIQRPPCVCVCTSSAAGATFFTNGRWAGGAWRLRHSLPLMLPAVHRHRRRCFANVPFLAHLLTLVVQPKRNCSAWQHQLLACSHTESGCALIFPLFSDCTHPSFYITGDTISNKIKDERYRTH